MIKTRGLRHGFFFKEITLMLTHQVLTQKLVVMAVFSSLLMACSPAEPESAQPDSVLLELEQALNNEVQQVSEQWQAFEREAALVAELLADSSTSQAPQAEALRMLNLELRGYVGVPYAHGLSQCRMVEVGARPCGGPDYYLPFSVANTDENEVISMAQRYTDLKRTFNQKYQMMGTCEVIAAPKLTYAGGQCIGLPYATE
jgi:hypothetical protein